MPADVRKRLGVGPGAVLEWDELNGLIFVRRAGRYSSEDIYKALFSKKPSAGKTLGQLRSGIRISIKRRHARD